MNDPVVCYHGTNRIALEGIMKSGFIAGCYFARHLEDALGFGGPIVFEVAFEVDKIPDGWQFRVDRIIPSEEILSVTHYEIARIFENTDLRREVFRDRT